MGVYCTSVLGGEDMLSYTDKERAVGAVPSAIVSRAAQQGRPDLSSWALQGALHSGSGKCRAGVGGGGGGGSILFTKSVSLG